MGHTGKIPREKKKKKSLREKEGGKVGDSGDTLQEVGSESALSYSTIKSMRKE